jgi:high-affinity nickel-transport protein
VFYNLTITVLSVLIALVVGVIVLAGVLTDRLHLESGPVAALGGLEMDNVGYIVVGLFVATWVVALTIWRLGRIEERYAEVGRFGG